MRQISSLLITGFLEEYFSQSPDFDSIDEIEKSIRKAETWNTILRLLTKRSKIIFVSSSDELFQISEKFNAIEGKIALHLVKKFIEGKIKLEEFTNSDVEEIERKN